MKLSEIGEFGLIQRLAAEFSIEYPPRPGASIPGLVVALGDDAVVTEPITEGVIWTTDTMVKGEHFKAMLTPWCDVGWKALASNVSDIAAMGGAPYLALVTLMLPSDFEVDDAIELYKGLRECAACYEVRLGGGDIVRSPVFAITVALAGKAALLNGKPTALRRDAASPGDLLAVTGTPGDSGGGLKALLSGRKGRSEAATILVSAHNRPQPRVALGKAAVNGGLRCGMDVSDGLVQDLGHIARASQVAVVIEASRLPLSSALTEVWPQEAMELALSGGEDYELILVGAPEAMETFVASADGDVTIIGRIDSLAPGSEPGVTVLDAHDQRITVQRGGWNHFLPA